ncbi:hypothetical protein [Paraburkholderia sp. 35.1]|uniref:hypothetical protein n=1 Tax=Paraburkholderia sp. 35.1 TaxID=2991058 RepID=UPI003D251A21
MALSVVHAQKNQRHIAQNPNTQKNAGICTGKTFTNADMSGTHAKRQNEIQSVFPETAKISHRHRVASRLGCVDGR